MKREDAIEKVRQMSLPKETMEILEALAPELRESEDERIRKEIVDYFKKEHECLLNDFRDKEDEKLLSFYNRALAYLEKQKEPENVSASTMIPSCWAEEPSLQKEQKPAEKLSKEEYVKRFKALCDAYEIKLPNREYDIYHLCDDLSKLSIDSGKQEWGEEDEKIIDTIVSVLGQYIDYKTVSDNGSEYATPRYRKEIDWLKSLRPPQDRCKDCPHRGDMFLLTQGIKSGKHELAIKFMNYLDENRPDGKMGLSNGECEDIDKAFKENDWAKILRYAEKYGKEN